MVESTLQNIQVLNGNPQELVEHVCYDKFKDHYENDLLNQ